jgi:Transposase, Mutator family
VLERLNQELKRRTHVIRIFPNPESCLRLIRALAVEIHEGWLETHCYLNMEPLAEQEKEPVARLRIGCSMNNQQSFLKVRLSRPIKLGRRYPPPTPLGLRQRQD